MLEVRTSWCSREGDCITNVVHARDVAKQPLKTKAETRMGYGTVAAKISVPPPVSYTHLTLPTTPYV